MFSGRGKRGFANTCPREHDSRLVTPANMVTSLVCDTRDCKAKSRTSSYFPAELVFYARHGRIAVAVLSLL
jgi:hypothetical protein